MTANGILKSTQAFPGLINHYIPLLKREDFLSFDVTVSTVLGVVSCLQGFSAKETQQ